MQRRPYDVSLSGPVETIMAARGKCWFMPRREGRRRIRAVVLAPPVTPVFSAERAEMVASKSRV